MKNVGKFLKFCFELFLVCYSIYLMFKTNVELKDVVWLAAMGLITLLTVESKAERTEEELFKIKNELSEVRATLYSLKHSNE